MSFSQRRLYSWYRRFGAHSGNRQMNRNILLPPIQLDRPRSSPGCACSRRRASWKPIRCSSDTSNKPRRFPTITLCPKPGSGGGTGDASRITTGTGFRRMQACAKSGPAADLARTSPYPSRRRIDVSRVQIEHARRRIPRGSFHRGAGETFIFKRTFDFIIIRNNRFGGRRAADVRKYSAVLARRYPIVLKFYNTLWKPLLGLATALGLKSRQPELNWLSRADVRNLLALADWEVVRKKRAC